MSCSSEATSAITGFDVTGLAVQLVVALATAGAAAASWRAALASRDTLKLLREERRANERAQRRDRLLRLHREVLALIDLYQANQQGTGAWLTHWQELRTHLASYEGQLQASQQLAERSTSVDEPALEGARLEIERLLTASDTDVHGR
jgi:hypothetical protein